MKLTEENLHLRRARHEYRCAGRAYVDRVAVKGTRCAFPILRGSQYVEDTGESAPYQSGSRYHVECCLREGFEIRPAGGL